jgi:hypothetical protein
VEPTIDTKPDSTQNQEGSTMSAEDSSKADYEYFVKNSKGMKQGPYTYDGAQALWNLTRQRLIKAGEQRDAEDVQIVRRRIGGAVSSQSQ